jgi:sialic acid synthase SpsE
MTNTPSTTELLKSMFRASKELEAGLREGGQAVVRGFEQRQREFDARKRQVEDDIKRGSKLSKGRIPF